MFSGGLLYFATILAATISAAPTRRAAQNDGLPFQVTNTTVKKVMGGDVSISFTVYDPDPMAKTSTVCSKSWKTGSKGYPTEAYELCEDTAFAWNMEKFTSVNNFVLDIEHRFEDPSVGDPPYNYVTNFGYAQINTTQGTYECTMHGRGNKDCTQTNETVIHAPIYAITAK